VILAGDIGGTKTRLALYTLESGRLVKGVEETYPSREHGTFDTLLAAFRSAHRDRIHAACFGVAGPVRGGHVRTTNLPWELDAHALASALGLARTWLVNDLESTAWGVTVLPEACLATLNAGTRDPQGSAAVIAAGTGLGMAGLRWNGALHEPIASEGGHASFAPYDERGVALRAGLARRFGHVSWERVLSGQGIVHCYEFLRDTGAGEEPARLAMALKTGDPAAAITAAAATVPLCAAALDLFVGLYGAAAGNLALTVMATAGVYVGGGIAPRIVDRLRAGGFMATFVAKGRMQPLLESMPVRVVLDDRAALIGAAQCARVREGIA
jgi:glucokinase